MFCRAIQHQPELASLSPDMAVGAFHAKVHVFSCMQSMGGRSKQGAGRTDGDNVEHLWSVLRLHAPVLKYMSTGVWQDLCAGVVRDFKEFSTSIGNPMGAAAHACIWASATFKIFVISMKEWD